MAAPRVVYNYLGCSGVKVSNICLGTMTFGGKQGGPLYGTEEDAHAILNKFNEYGGNFIDTANIYNNGKSEEFIGSWLQNQPRHKYVLATKVRGETDPNDPNAKGLSRAHVMHAVDESLRRLKTDYIDLYQIHAWDDGVPLEETLCALNDLVQLGKVRYVGASNVLGWQMQKIVELSKQNGWVPWVSLQQQYSLLCRESEYEVFDVCKNERIGVLPWSPLKGGWLSGKFKKNQDAPADSRVAWASVDKSRVLQSAPDYEQFNNEKTWNLLDTLDDIAKIQGKSVAQVSLRWLLQKRGVCSVVIGARTLQQLEDNIGAACGWQLTQDQMETLDEVSMYPVPYPYEMVWRLNKTRKRQE